MSYTLPEPVEYMGRVVRRLAWCGEPVDAETVTWVHPNNQPDWETFRPALAFVPFGCGDPYEKDRGVFYPKPDPRSAFGQAMHDILGERRDQWSVTNSAGSMIGQGVEIPASCDVGFGNVIYSGVVIGEKVTIGNNNVIGGPGYNLYQSEYPGQPPVRFLHVGGVEIGHSVVIQNNTNIDAGILSPTRIGSGSAIDSQIHIAHDVQIGKGCNVIAGAVVCGWAVIEDRAHVAPNASVRNRITVGRGAIVGLAANAVKDVPAQSVVMGNPARPKLMPVQVESRTVDSTSDGSHGAWGT